MNALENYKRDNKYISSLQQIFDTHIEIDQEQIETILNTIDLIEDNQLPQPEKDWRTIYEKKDEKAQLHLQNRFTKEVKQKHQYYKIILKRFVEEHLPYTEAVIFVLKNQIKGIKDVMGRLEIDYFENPQNDFDQFIFKFRDISLDLLNELITDLTKDYQQYLKEIDLTTSTTASAPTDDIDFTTTVSKVLLLNELGIIDFIKTNYPTLATNNTHLAKVLSKFTEANYETIRRAVADMKTGQSNDPYNREDNLKTAQNLFNTYNLSKKGE